ncbi:T9SS type A sorting domain-containing protein [Sporocytophaga myxococcoides]|uniref:T9SS type A sorting domain-containing protein n=1 Tax=Sporocytophaga myxococcoides TaxID=153721 RepID=UPI0009DBD43B|nr:T9SS type A sorting domain-containing protein [Sporocytophaga myxococcoides]
MNIYHYVLKASLLFLMSIQVFGQDCNLPLKVGGFGDRPHLYTGIPDGSNLKAISAGGAHVVAVKEDGTVVAWGSNEYGEIDIPTGLSGVKAVVAGEKHSVALKEDGTVVAWGDNRAGQTTIPNGLQGVKAICSRGSANLALKEDGTVVGWGYSQKGLYFGQLDLPNNLSGVKAISLGAVNGVALKDDGTVVVWGDNGNGQLIIPAEVKNIKAIAGGDYHILAVTQEGNVICWGNANSYLRDATNVKEIVTSPQIMVALTEDGKLIADGLPRISQVPVGLSGVKAVACNYDYTVYLAPVCNASVESADLPNASMEKPYSFKFNATDICNNVNWTIASGSLPLGLELSASGTLSGTPEESIEAQFTLRVKDETCEAQKDFLLKVNGIDNIVNPDFPGLQIYPNPAANFIDIKLTQASDNVSLTFFDSKGNQVLKTDNVSQRIDISSLSSGLYYIQLTSSQKTAHLKLLKN